MKNVAVIIQARTGSSRLPGKVVLPFSKERSILEIIIDRINASTAVSKMILATSVSAGDDLVAEIAIRKNVSCFRGSENDVLQRFIDAAEENRVEVIVRVCADNPFIDVPLLDELLAFATGGEADYYSYKVKNDTPAILSHWGIFAEIVTLNALKKTAALTDESLFHEHVTNYIYTHPDIFSCRWLAAPEEIISRDDIRFTIDTQADFDLMQRIWTLLEESGIPANFRDALRLISTHSGFTDAMRIQIEANSK